MILHTHHRWLSSYTAICLHDVSAWPHMMVNGGTWYFQNVLPSSRVMQMLTSFRARALALLDGYPAFKLSRSSPRGALRSTGHSPLGPAARSP